MCVCVSVWYGHNSRDTGRIMLFWGGFVGLYWGRGVFLGWSFNLDMIRVKFVCIRDGSIELFISDTNTITWSIFQNSYPSDTFFTPPVCLGCWGDSISVYRTSPVLKLSIWAEVMDRMKLFFLWYYILKSWSVSDRYRSWVLDQSVPGVYICLSLYNDKNWPVL